MEKEFVWTDELVKELIADLWDAAYADKKVDDFVWHKTKRPLFITEDGVQLFEGEPFYYVDKNWQAGENMTFHNYKYFSTKRSVDEFILMNKPVLSLIDILNTSILPPEEVGNHQHFLRIKDIAKQKING